MIGFNNNNFAGKTAEEINEEKEAEKQLFDEYQFSNNFTEWVNKHDEKLKSLYDNFVRLSNQNYRMKKELSEFFDIGFYIWTIAVFLLGIFFHIALQKVF